MRHRNELAQIHARFFHNEKSPGGTPNFLGQMEYTGSQRTVDRKRQRERSTPFWNPQKQGTLMHQQKH